MTKLIELYKDLDKPNCIAVILGILGGLFLGPAVIMILFMFSAVVLLNIYGSWATRLELFLGALALTSIICLLIYLYKIAPPTSFPSWQDIKNFLVR